MGLEHKELPIWEFNFIQSLLLQKRNYDLEELHKSLLDKLVCVNSGIQIN